MARKIKIKRVYRDKESNRLITEKEANRRDANTFTKEEFLIVPADPVKRATSS